MNNEQDRAEYNQRITALKETIRHIERLLPKSERFPERDEFLSLLQCKVGINLNSLSELPSK